MKKSRAALVELAVDGCRREADAVTEQGTASIDQDTGEVEIGGEGCRSRPS